MQLFKKGGENVLSMAWNVSSTILTLLLLVKYELISYMDVTVNEWESESWKQKKEGDSIIILEKFVKEY